MKTRPSSIVCGVLFWAGCTVAPKERNAPNEANPSGPNVVLIVTDDQGWGDIGFHGNTALDTPHLDSLARESARLDAFYVSPVCTPTRAALMTGRAPQRTRAFDTYRGRAMMEPAEVTVAELLREAGWATGIFGKWHLGDCYPLRAMDQGFETSLVHRGGGIGQPSDPEGGERRYTDPVLFWDGVRVETQGYCTDVYFDAALEWIGTCVEKDRPFFAYLATNAPHGPFHDVPPELYEKYRARDLSPASFPASIGHPLPENHDEDRLARIFAMIENIDQNVGRLTAELERLGVSEDTLVLFLVDNGPNSRRWVGGMRGQKTEVYEGGVRSPFFARWPARLTPGMTSDRIACHMDVLPTLLEACGVDPPEDSSLDGKSLLPLLEGSAEEWPERAITIQAHRGDTAHRYHNFFTRTQRWKLVHASGFGREVKRLGALNFELYDMEADPLEQVNVASRHPEVVAELRDAYDRWFDDVVRTREDNFAPPAIHLGAEAAPRVVLTRQDWRVLTGDGWGSKETQGQWSVDVQDEGPFQVRVRFLPGSSPNEVRLHIGRSWLLPADGAEVTFPAVLLPRGAKLLQVDVLDTQGAVGPYQVILERLPNDARGSLNPDSEDGCSYCCTTDNIFSRLPALSVSPTGIIVGSQEGGPPQ